MKWWHHIPPPMQPPCTAAITGCGIDSMILNDRCISNSLRLIPTAVRPIIPMHSVLLVCMIAWYGMHMMHDIPASPESVMILDRSDTIDTKRQRHLHNRCYGCDVSVPSSPAVNSLPAPLIITARTAYIIYRSIEMIIKQHMSTLSVAMRSKIFTISPQNAEFIALRLLGLYNDGQHAHDISMA